MIRQNQDLIQSSITRSSLILYKNINSKLLVRNKISHDSHFMTRGVLVFNYLYPRNGVELDGTYDYINFVYT